MKELTRHLRQLDDDFECVACGYTVPDGDDPLYCALCASDATARAMLTTINPRNHERRAS